MSWDPTKRLASVLADAILEQFPMVTEVDLTATKLHPPAKVTVERASVEVCRFPKPLEEERSLT